MKFLSNLVYADFETFEAALAGGELARRLNELLAARQA